MHVSDPASNLLSWPVMNIPYVRTSDAVGFSLQVDRAQAPFTMII